jgi:hypothetical protein
MQPVFLGGCKLRFKLLPFSKHFVNNNRQLAGGGCYGTMMTFASLYFAEKFSQLIFTFAHRVGCISSPCLTFNKKKSRLTGRD